MPEFSNSPLVSFTQLSPNCNKKRTHAIDTVTIHCTAGQRTVEQLGKTFAPASRKASCNYAIGSDGRVALIVPEESRSWCSSDASNDHRAVTIEVSSDDKTPYAVNDAAYASLIYLVADICRRARRTRTGSWCRTSRFTSGSPTRRAPGRSWKIGCSTSWPR